MKLTERARRIAPSPTIAVMTEARRLQAEGIDVVDLGPGEPDFPTPAPVAEAGLAAIRDGFTRYTPVAGIPELRRAIAESYAARHGVEPKPSEIVVTVGGKQALYQTCLTLFQAGDEVLIPTPCWVSFPEMVKLADAVPVLAPTAASDGHRPTAAALRERWTSATRGVIVCSPANPHGAMIEADELEAIVELAAERGAVVLFDECYEHFVYERPHVSAAPLFARHPETVVLAGTFSKTFAMTGWRIGWMVAAEPIAKAAAAIQGHATTNVSSIAQKAALAALAPAGMATIPPMIAEYRARRDLVVEALAAIPGIACAPPEGAFYVFPDVSELVARSGVADSTELCRRWIEEARVAAVPGAAFFQEGHVRLSFATSRERLTAGLERIGEWARAEFR